MATRERTGGGSVTAEFRKKFAVLSGGRFPIGSKRTARSALRLRGRTRSVKERMTVIRAAAKYLSEAARAALKADIAGGKVLKGSKI